MYKKNECLILKVPKIAVFLQNQTKIVQDFKFWYMIQRIQSVFLVASLCFLVPMFFVPVAELVHETGVILAFHLTGFYQTEAGTTVLISRQISIMLFGILICALNLIALFMYKSRVLQLRLCIYNILLLAGLMGVIIFMLYTVENINSVSFSLPAVFPVVSMILHYLAFRGIRKDELMVQALSRLR